MLKKIAIPDLISLSSLFLGFWALLLISDGNPVKACWLIVICAILDGLDGAVARLFQHGSKYGQQIDSLVDLVVFGVVPAFLLSKSVFGVYGWMGTTLAFIFLLSGLVRLARFNVIAMKGESVFKHFTGMPITCGAVTLVGFFLYMNHLTGSLGDVRLWLSLTIALSILMVSPLPYYRLPVIQGEDGKYPWLSAAILLLGTTAIIIDPPTALFPIMMLYMILGPIGWFAAQFQKLRDYEDTDEVDDKPPITLRHKIFKLHRRKQR